MAEVFYGPVHVDPKVSQEAEAWFLGQVKVEPQNPVNYAGLGLISLCRDNYEEALSWFIKAVEANPSFRDEMEFNRSYLFI